jgi:O-antigen/teichoic acid export membrane protein
MTVANPGAPSRAPSAAPAPPLGPGALVAAGAMAFGHVLSWAFTVLGARLLAPADYGELAALIALVVAGSVPGTAVQAVVARHVVLRDRAGLPLGPLVRTAARWVGLLTAGLTAATLAAAPAVASFLHLRSATAVVWTAAAVAPLPALFAVQGLLQGRERFGRLTALLLTAGAVKLAAGIGLLAAGYGVDGAMAGTAAGTAAALALGAAMVLPMVLPMVLGTVRAGAGAGPGGAPDAPLRLGGELRGATVSLIGLTLLASLDLLLARHFLPAAASGLYAAGSVVVKVAYWAPQSVVTVIFPRLAARQGGRLAGMVAVAVALMTAALAAGGALVAARPALLPFGAAYAPVGADLPRFALLGGCLALLQLACFSGIATADRSLHRLVAAAVVVEAALIAGRFHDSVTAIVTTAVVVVAALLVACRLALRGADRDARPAP